jgi:hypothetical protein
LVVGSGDGLEVVFQANGNDIPESETSFLKSDTYFLHTAKPVISVC